MDAAPIKLTRPVGETFELMTSLFEAMATAERECSLIPDDAPREARQELAAQIALAMHYHRATSHLEGKPHTPGVYAFATLMLRQLTPPGGKGAWRPDPEQVREYVESSIQYMLEYARRQRMSSPRPGSRPPSPRR